MVRGLEWVVRAHDLRRVAEQERGDGVAADAGPLLVASESNVQTPTGEMLWMTENSRRIAPPPILMLCAPLVLVTDPANWYVLSFVVSGTAWASPISA